MFGASVSLGIHGLGAHATLLDIISSAISEE